MELSASLNRKLASLTPRCESLVVHPRYYSILMVTSIFLYFFILAFFAGIVYFFYTVWVAPYFPQKRRGKGGDAKKSGAAKKTEDVPAVDTTAASTASSFNSEWIPAHHIQKPEARKVKGARSKSRA